MKLEKNCKELELTTEEIAHIIDTICVMRGLGSVMRDNQLDGLSLCNEPVTADQLDLMADELELQCGFHREELS